MKTLYSIAGMQHRPGAQELIAKLKVGAELVLVRDRDNKHDPNAVEVWTSVRSVSGVGPLHIGFVKASEVRPIARELDQRGHTQMLAHFAVDGSRWPQVEVDLEA